jgi:patatin-related protein
MHRSTEDLIPLSGNQIASLEKQRDPAFHRTLRVALAMKGGVSLAVWIGGAVAEFDLLRRIRIYGPPNNPTAYLVPIETDESAAVIERARSYSEMMIAARIDQVEFDVLAGASAGGLNAVLFGVAQRAGVRFDAVLSTWLSAGSIWRLLRKPWEPRFTSVLDGDHFFFGEVRKAIEGLRSLPTSHEHEARAVSVELSGTMVDADKPADWGFQEGRAHFRFTGRKPTEREPVVAGAVAPPRGREIPGRTGEVDVAAIDRLAYAARTTSSFPGAFEPARIFSRPVGEEPRPNPPEPFIDFDYAFSHHRSHEEGDAIDRGQVRPFRAIDGGVADNIPIDRALRVVREMPAEDFVSRAIIYLEPDPAKLANRDRPPAATVPPAPDEPPARIARMIDNVRNSLRLRGVRESGDEEIDRLERFRRERFLWQGRKRSFASLDIGYDAPKAHDAYSRYRAAADLSLISDALSDPAVWQLGTDLTARASITAASRDLLVALEDSIFTLFDPSFRRVDRHQDAILLGPQAILDAASCALAWMRELETIHFDKRTWFSPAEESQRVSARRLINDVAAAARTRRDLALFEAVRAPRGSNDAQNIVKTWLRCNHSEIDESHWKTLGEAIEILGNLSQGLGPKLTVDVPWTRFLTLTNVDAKDLAPFTAPIGIPMPVSNLTFDVIAATEPGELDSEFHTLQLAQSVELAEQWLKLNDIEFDKARMMFAKANLDNPDGKRTLHPLTKLAGTNLWNFGAFFSARWRANDWWWGRLDGAAGLVRILGDIGRLEPHRVATTARSAQEAVLREAGTSDHGRPFGGDRTESDPRAVARRITAGAHRLRNLGAGYLVAVSSRAARASLRAARTGRGRPAEVLLTALLPPILLNMPFIVVPVRALFLALVIAAVVCVVASDTVALPIEAEPGIWVGAVAVVIAGVLLLFALARGALELRRARRRRSTVLDDIAGYETALAPDSLSQHLSQGLRARAERAHRLSWATWGVAAISFVSATVLTLWQGGGQPGAWCMAAISAGALIASARFARRLDAPRPDGSNRAWLFASIAPILVIVFSHPIAVLLSQPVGIGTPVVLRDWFVPALVATVGLVAAITLTQGWLPARRATPEIPERPEDTEGRKPWGSRVSRWIGWGGRSLWALALVATAGVAGFAAWVTMQLYVGSTILTQPAAAAVLAWFLGAHTLWWLSERASGDDLVDVDDEPFEDERAERYEAAQPPANG